METLSYSMNRFTTEQLIGEVVRRAAADGPALRSFETVIIQARLAAGDRLQAAPDCGPEAVPAMARTPVFGTLAVGLAEDGGIAALLPAAGHEVVAGTLDSHSHDHTHGKKAAWRLA